MTNLSKEQIEEFKKIYKQETGKDISDEEALDSATSLVEMVRLIYKPIKKADFEKYNKEN